MLSISYQWTFSRSIPFLILSWRSVSIGGSTHCPSTVLWRDLSWSCLGFVGQGNSTTTPPASSLTWESRGKEAGTLLDMFTWRELHLACYFKHQEILVSSVTGRFGVAKERCHSVLGSMFSMWDSFQFWAIPVNGKGLCSSLWRASIRQCQTG